MGGGAKARLVEPVGHGLTVQDDLMVGGITPTAALRCGRRGRLESSCRCCRSMYRAGTFGIEALQRWEHEHKESSAVIIIVIVIIILLIGMSIITSATVSAHVGF